VGIFRQEKIGMNCIKTGMNGKLVNKKIALLTYFNFVVFYRKIVKYSLRKGVEIIRLALAILGK
jgi:hypothetical protein